jgi:hypothetical protein
MTAGLLVTGAAHLGTASGLRGVPLPGRLLLAVGGAATAAVGLLPVDRLPTAHAVAAGIGFGALALWPVAATRRSGAPVLRPAVTATASGLLLALLAWFVVELSGDGDAVGLSERAVAGAHRHRAGDLVIADLLVADLVHLGVDEGVREVVGGRLGVLAHHVLLRSAAGPPTLGAREAARAVSADGLGCCGPGSAEGVGDDVLRGLLHLRQVLGADEGLGVDLVHVLGAGRPGREPAGFRDDLEPPIARIVARRLGQSLR